MAPYTKISLLLIITIIGCKCDNISNIKAELLLRGSGEEAEDLQTSPIIEEEVNDEEKSLNEELENTEEVTTEHQITVTEENDDVDSTAMVDTTTYNYVYKDDGPNNDTIESSSPSFPTTKMADENETSLAGVGVVRLDDERDVSLREPKLSDSPGPKQQDKRNYEPKPHSKPSVSKSSTLKDWLQDSWLRPPAGLMVPLRPMAISRALAVWKDLTAEGLDVTDIVLVGYDSNGVNWRSRHSLQPTSTGAGQRTVSEALSKLLLKYQDVNPDSNTDGTMKALAMAAKLVPYDSALFLITDKGAADVQRLPLALRALVEKRLKVYTIWTDPGYPSSESETQLQTLRNISKHTEGEVLPYTLQVIDLETEKNLPVERWDSVEGPQPRRGRVHDMFEEEKFDTLLVRRGGGEAISLGVPVENGVSALRIYIEGLVEHAVLYPPNDAPQVDLFNESSVLAFSPQSRTEGLSPRDVYLAFPGAHDEPDTLSVLPMRPTPAEAPAPTVGTWHLSVRCDTCDYRLCVAARSLIHFHTHLRARDSREALNIRVTGPVASVRESGLVDEYGVELAKLPFDYQPQPISADGQESPAERPAELIADVALPSVKGSKVYAKIVGRDIRGEPFVRLSGPLTTQEIRMGRSASIAFPDSNNDVETFEELNSKVSNRLVYNESSILPQNRAVSQVVNQRGSILTAVQIGLSTRLYGAPGDTLRLHFEVTNYREQTVRFTFQAVGELRFLTGISPLSQNLASGEMVNVVVTATISANAQPGARDLITFTAFGLEQVSISTYVYVTNPTEGIIDTWAPELRHQFQGSCIGRMGDDCAQHIWSASIIARDRNAGLLRLTSSPLGLIYDSNFIAGTREEVVAVYRATCCAPRLMVTAVDAFGNANSYVVDISGYLSEAGIAAIVLGVFLFIALVALLVFLIYWCVKRRKESRELPYSTSTSRNLS